MIKKCFAIRDDATHEFANVITEDTEYKAVRSFESSVTSAIAHEDGLFFTHTDDFSLWYLFDYDTETGQSFVPDGVVPPVLICRASECDFNMRFRKENQ